MPRLNHTDTIVLTSKKITVQEFIKTLIYLPASEISRFFQRLGITFPRETRIFVLRENLRERVAETRKSRLTLADELNYRLSWFAEFTETQLENLLVFFNDPTINKNFLEDLWIEFLTVMVAEKVQVKDFEELYKLSLENESKWLPNMSTYNRDLKYLFFDEEGKIDGLTQQRIRPVLYKSSTLSEIRDFGDKYDVDVPRRLKKNELLEIIVKELKDRGDYSVEREQELKKMPVILMQRFATDHDIKASTELKKEEIIEYVLVNAKETKQSYYEPTAYDYDLEPEPIEEIVKEEVKKEQAPIQQVTEQVVDFTAVILEMQRLRKSVEELTREMKSAPVRKETIIERQTPPPVIERAPVVEKVVEEEIVIEQAPIIEEEPVIEEVVIEEPTIEEVIIEEEVIVTEKPVEEKAKKAKKPKKKKSRGVRILCSVITVILIIVVLFIAYTIYTIYDDQFLRGFYNWLMQYAKISKNDPSLFKQFQDWIENIINTIKTYF